MYTRKKLVVKYLFPYLKLQTVGLLVFNSGRPNICTVVHFSSNIWHINRHLMLILLKHFKFIVVTEMKIILTKYLIEIINLSNFIN